MHVEAHSKGTIWQNEEEAAEGGGEDEGPSVGEETGENKGLHRVILAHLAR